MIVVLAALVNSEPIRLTTLAYAAAVVAAVLIGQRMPVQGNETIETYISSNLILRE